MNPTAGQHDPPPGHVRLRYWASARAAAGVAEETLDVDGPVTLEWVKDRSRQLHAGEPRFAAVLETCSVLVGDRPVSSEGPATVQVQPGETVEFLPPFAGG